MAQEQLVTETPTDLSQAKAFAWALWGNSRGSGDIVACLLRNRAGRERNQFSGDFQLDTVGEGIDPYVDEGWDVYVTPCRFDPDREQGKASRRASDVVLVPGVWSDLDVKSDQETLPQTEEELEQVLAALPEATILVDTGSGGRHAYWLFSIPCTDVERAKKLTTSWIIHISNEASKVLGREIKFDPVGDLSRVLKLPGTWRHPKPPIYQPRPVVLLQSDGCRYTIGDIESIIPDEILNRYERFGTAAIATELSVPADDVRVQAYVSKILKDEKAQLAAWQSGEPPGRNSMLNRSAFNLGTLGAHGLVDVDFARQELLDACGQNGLLQEDGIGTCEATFDSGWASGVSKPRKLPDWGGSDGGDEKEESKGPDGEDLWPEPGDWESVAKKLLDVWQTDKGQPVLHYYKESWYQWIRSEGHWEEVDNDVIHAYISNVVNGRTYKDNKGNPAKWKMNINYRNEIRAALQNILLVSPKTNPPIWLVDDDDEVDRPAAEDLIVVQNGMLRWRTRELLGHDSRLFNFVSLPLDYDPGAECKEWIQFLQSLFPDDQESIDALQEVFGYMITGKTFPQKIPVLTGRPRTGKSTIGNILTKLVGERNVAGLSLASLTSRFSMSTLMGKTLNLCVDSRIRGDTYEIVQKLNSISGGDSHSIERKFKNSTLVKLQVRFMIVSNELPGLNDPSGAIATRLLPITIGVDGWLGREDFNLPNRLNAELSGILNWSLDGADRLERNGQFTEPQSAKSAAMLINETTSHISDFVGECCVLDPNTQIFVNELYKVWESWCKENGYQSGAKSKLGRDLHSIANIGVARPRADDGKQRRAYIGIGLKDSARERWLSNRWL